jgi:AraC-like DNA-binding protein
MLVKEILNSLDIPFKVINLGEVELNDALTIDQTELFRIQLLESGLELIEDKKAVIIEKIKNVIIEMIHYEDELPKVNFSDYLSSKLNYNYTYLANLFSETEAITIEHYIIIHKIERVKELIVYDELNLSEIAWKLHYSSVAHLSHQFKKVTGLTPSFFKSLKNKKKELL